MNRFFNALKNFFEDDDFIAQLINTVTVEIEPETYSDYYKLVTDTLFKTTAEEGIQFLGRYIEGKGSLWNIINASQKHQYLQQDIAKANHSDPDRIEEVLVRLRNIRRETGALALDTVVANSYPLPDEFDRRATVLLAYELGYLEPEALDVCVPSAVSESRDMQGSSSSRNLTKTDGQKYIAKVLQIMDDAALERTKYHLLMLLINSSLMQIRDSSSREDLQSYTTLDDHIIKEQQTGDAESLGSVHKKIEKHAFAEGKTAFAAGNLEAAINCFVLETTANPKNAWAWYYLGRAHHALARTATAEDAFMRAVALKPAFATRDYQEALDYITAKDYRRAGWAIERAVEIASYCDTAPKEKILETLTTLGVLYKEGKEVAKDHATTRRLFTAALSLAPDYVHADYHLGTLAFMERDFLSAEQHFDRAIRHNPKHRWAQYQLGRVLEMTGNSNVARDHYQIAADLGLEQATAALKQVKQ